MQYVYRDPLCYGGWKLLEYITSKREMHAARKTKALPVSYSCSYLYFKL